MTIRDFISALSGGHFDEKLRELYGGSDSEMLRNRIRYIDACERFSKNYPQCDKIRVYSLSAKISVKGVPFFLSADKIMIQSADDEYCYVSDEIPENFEEADLNDSTAMPEYLEGYSLCVSGEYNKKQLHDNVYFEDFAENIGKLRNDYTEHEIFSMAVCCDEKKGNQSARDAVMSGDIYGFFGFVNNSYMYTLCSPKVKTAVLLGRNFLGEDGAVTAESDVVKAFVPSYIAEDYRKIMSAVFGEDNCRIMQIRYTGGSEFTL